MPFHNIFSNKKIKEKPSMTIIADHREKNSLVIAELVSLNNKIEFKQLEVADYIIGKTAVERKTGADLISSMLNKRLFIQLENLKQYENQLLIIESYQSLNLEETNLNENAIRGLLLSISLDYKIPIVFTKDPKETAIFLNLIAKKKKSEISLRAKLRMSDSERLQFILEGFPNIGPITAKKLLKEYKTLKNMVNTNPDVIHTLLGKKADKFLELLNKIYENQDDDNENPKVD